MKKLGVVCGRFQIFHLEHLNYVLAAKEQCDRLIVGITSPDASTSPLEKADKNRGLKEANPCSYYERIKMIEGVLMEAGVDRRDFDIVPFPIGKPELIKAYIPENASIFVTVLDQWGRCKTDRLRDYGYDVCVLWERTEKGISSSMIRSRIMQGEPWSELVPAATYRYVTSEGIDLRIKNGQGDS